MQLSDKSFDTFQPWPDTTVWPDLGVGEYIGILSTAHLTLYLCVHVHFVCLFMFPPQKPSVFDRFRVLKAREIVQWIHF